MIDYNDLFKTTCIRYLDDDECDEIVTFNWFKNKFLLKSDVLKYEEVSYIIICCIENHENKIFFYNYIYERVILDIVIAIQNKNYNYAYNKFNNTILVLEGIISDLQELSLKNKKILN